MGLETVQGVPRPQELVDRPESERALEQELVVGLGRGDQQPDERDDEKGGKREHHD